MGFWDLRFNTVKGRQNVSSRFTEKSSLIMDYKKVINPMNETMGKAWDALEISFHFKSDSYC